MRQRIQVTVETIISTDVDEVTAALEKLHLKVIDCRIGRPFAVNPERDGTNR